MLHNNHAKEISCDRPLPEELASELMAYKEFIELMQSTPLLQLNSAVPGSPELRNEWWRDVTYPNPNVCSVHTKKPVFYDCLLMLFTILADEQRRGIIGLQNVMDEIERLSRRDPTQKARISPMVARMFSDLALTGELECQLKIYQPRLFELFYKREKQYTRDTSFKMLQQTSRMMEIAQYMDEMRVTQSEKPCGACHRAERNENIASVRTVPSNQLKSKDLSIKTASSGEVEPLRQFADDWAHRIGSVTAVQILRYGVLAYGTCTSTMDMSRPRRPSPSSPPSWSTPTRSSTRA
ncbi:hypothetical protein T440DRAFT_52720 [Plenodomus tracheiphilus IPT5]|uniref:Uncharacterized protein n=1 Tax=Plenodomus tracheiphilus IPT5 TaxID=1408161 RepID=A0A6A7APS5_9PLEO|nr:hypothetical protein T440DRAFT_52720 [Plenodomus tracheiphilus IPT5]